MPADDTNLENSFSEADYATVAADDGDRLSQTATGEHAIFQFKNKNTAQEAFKVTWNGQSDLAPSVSTVYLQIYNRTTTAWETLASNNSAAADTDFTMTGIKTASLDDYYDANEWVSCRVYQEAVG